MKKTLFTFFLILLFAGCGGGSGTSSNTAPLTQTGTFIDAEVVNLEYNTSSGIHGFTDENGHFKYELNDTIEFKIGNFILGKTLAKNIITPVELSDNNTTKANLIAYILQNLDTDTNQYNDKIVLPPEEYQEYFSVSSFNTQDIINAVNDFKNKVYITFTNVSLFQAYDNLVQNLKQYNYDLPEPTSDYNINTISLDNNITEPSNETNTTVETNTTSSETQTNTKTIVRVFTLAPVYYALVTDAKNQVAIFDPKTATYTFNNPVVYPIKATVTPSTFIDVDYDGIKTSNDLLPIFSTLSSYTDEINFITNITDQTNTLQSDVKNLYNTDIDIPPYTYDENTSNIVINPDVAKLYISAYNYYAKNLILNSPSDIKSDFDYIQNFYNTYLTNIPDQMRYLTFYDALTLLDKKLVKRADTLHKPVIKYLRNDINITAINNNYSVFDIAVDDDNVFTAAGHDEFALLDENNLSLIKKSTPSLQSFGINLYDDTLNRCVFLADTSGFKIFSYSSGDFNQTAFVTTYLSGNSEVNFTQTNLTDVNEYISPLNSKRLLAINTDDNGFYLININGIMNECNLSKEINDTMFLIPPTKTPSISSAFRNDGTYLYVSNGPNGITGYDISNLDPNIIANTQTDFTLYDNESAYNLLPMDNDNEIFVSTNRGIQTYNIDNDNYLHFISEYTSEGAMESYHPKMQFLSDRNMLIFTDGYMGVKVLKYDSSFNPMLCGVAYFSPADDTTKLAKVNSIKYNNGYLYVGVDSLGVVKFKFDDMLFEHCKE